MSEDHPVIAPKKLIEVALPLDAINAACAREKSIRHGHPSTLHLWWARRPLAAARAVIFSQMVNDPEDIWRLKNPGKEPNKQERGHWTKARKKLFEIIEDLVKWENTTNEEVLERGREEIRKSWREVCELNKSHPRANELFNPEKMPGLHDPFAGGGAIPLEAQRLGLEASASDLNPVAVLINKAMIEIPPMFAGRPPVHPDARQSKDLFNKEWRGAEGLAEDVRRYGAWMREEAEKRIGHLYPKVTITTGMAKERPDLRPLIGQELTVIAWIWARTVKSPNPAYSGTDVPLASTFILSTKPGKETYVEPVLEGGSYRFTVRRGDAPAAAKTGTSFGVRKGFRCLLSNAAISFSYIREQGLAHRMGDRMMAIVADSPGGRVYLPPTSDHERIATTVQPSWKPEVPIANPALSIRVPLYGIEAFGDLFTKRQLVSLTTFADLVAEAREQVLRDGTGTNRLVDSAPLAAGGKGPRAYAEAVSLYLACIVDKFAESHSSICTWSNSPKNELVVSTFRRQALPMTWDFGEANAFADSSGSFTKVVAAEVKVLEVALPAAPAAIAVQCDSQHQQYSLNRFVSTDPPYYDNIGYADLSDYFYVWLRRSMRSVYPDLLSTIAVPKADELVATPYRHGSKEKAEKFFLTGMTETMRNLAVSAHPSAPITIYYAFKQADTEAASGTSSSGWETFLAAVILSGLSIAGTWPMRTERAERSVSLGTNSLASSIILVCRPRSRAAGAISRRQFVRLLNEVLPDALAKMTAVDGGEYSPVAPVDLSQAIIGPGMAIFSRYDAVLEADGTPMTVKTALQLINRFLAEDDFDSDTQFCLHWFDQHGWETGKFGEADTLARAKGTSVDGVKAAGVIESGGGNVRLLKWADYASDWDPAADQRLPVWEALHQLVRVFKAGGESAAGKLLASIASQAEPIRQLAYRLYTLCERAGRADDARAYNELITSWAPIEAAAASRATGAQKTLFD
jgi:putative DNA methylase